ncbi:MAG: HAD-IA family hydrolase [Candidatus Dependentiae bacterium]|nr:HAD-IA family hydrolase [Candidatus Dependentiae bacterium]
MIEHIQNKKNLSKIEKKFWIQTVSVKTIPAKLIASRCIIPGSIELLRDLKNAGYNLYVISNWDSLSFPILEKQFPEIFTHEGQKTFDDIIISGKVGMVKPDHIIFEKALSKFGIQASDAVFIDDVIENIQAAEKVGIESIHCIKENMKHVRMHLASILKNKSK